MQSDKLAKILLQKGLQDQHAMNRLAEDAAIPDEIVGFHAQQAVEKMIKGVLAHCRIEYERTHKLRRLVAILGAANIAYPPEVTESIALTPFAVELRYDMLPVLDDDASPFNRQWARHCIGRIAEWAASIIEGSEG